MECEFCKKTFSTKPNLVAHQKTAKYCLEIQGKTNDQFKCRYCEKVFTCQQRLIDHTDSACKMKDKTKYEQEILKIKEEFSLYKKQEKIRSKEKDVLYDQKLKEKDLQLSTLEKSFNDKDAYISKLETKIEKLESKLEKIGEKLEAKLEKFEDAVVTNMAATTHALEVKSSKSANAATTNNTTLNTNITVNNFLNLSQEHVKKVLSERLDYNVVYAGQAGLATFVFDNILKDATGKVIYRCVDASRQMFEFVDENGETVRDMKAEKLTQSLLKGDVIKLGLEAAAVGWNTENEKLNNERVGVFGPKVNEYAELNRNNTVFRSKVSSLTT